MYDGDLGSIVEANDESFQEEIVRSRIPMIAVFYAYWCPHSRSLLEILPIVAEEYRCKVKFVKVEIERKKGERINPMLHDSAGIKAYPTIAAFNSSRWYVGQLVSEKSSEEQMNDLLGLISKILTKAA